MDGEATAAIRSAFGSGEFDKARRLWADHASKLQDAIVQGSASQSDLAEMRDLIEWARGVVTCFRAQAVKKLSTAQAAELYQDSPPSMAPRMQVRF